MIFVLTGATLVIPWNRIAFGWVAVVPAIDIVAITLMQLAAPDPPSACCGSSPRPGSPAAFGLLGLAAVIVAVAGIVSVLTALNEQQITYATVLMPLVLVAVATTSHLAARRSDAQRSLLAKQAQLLRRVLERTRRQEQEVTEVLDAVDFGVIRITPDGQVAVTNDAHGRLQQAIRADADAAGENADDGAEREEIPAFRDDGLTRCPRRVACRTRSARRGVRRSGGVVRRRTGPRQALSITARRLIDSSGHDVGAVVVSRDVTTELTALRARDELVASVSHELRTPLTSILGYLDLAIDDPDLPDHLRSSLDVAERNAERLLGIIADILAASSSSTSIQASLTPLAIDAREIVRASAEALAPRASGRAISIDMTGLEDGIRLGRPAAPASGGRQPPLECDHVQPRRRHGLPRHDHATAPPAGSSSATPGRASSETSVPRLFQRFYKAGRGPSFRHGPRTRDQPRHRPGARRRDRPAQLRRRRLDVHRETAAVAEPTRKALMILEPRPLQRPGHDRRRGQRERRRSSSLETLLRRDEGAGRIWALAFLAAMLTTLAYVIWVAVARRLVGGRRGQRRVRRRHRLHVARMPAVQRRRWDGLSPTRSPSPWRARRHPSGSSRGTGRRRLGRRARGCSFRCSAFAGAGRDRVAARRAGGESRTAWVLARVLGLPVAVLPASRTTAFVTVRPRQRAVRAVVRHRSRPASLTVDPHDRRRRGRRRCCAPVACRMRGRLGPRARSPRAATASSTRASFERALVRPAPSAPSAGRSSRA